jgi:Zn-dependent protease
MGAFALFTGKAKFLFAGLKLFKFTPVLSMIGTSLTYSLFFGPAYAVGMVGQIFVHEAGHAVALRHYGVPFSPMVMVPFMGAVIVQKGQVRNAYQDAVVAIAGPVAGTAAAVGCAAIATSTDSQLMYALADFGFMINLFNLLPIGALDGGRIAGAIHPGVGAAGVLGGAGMAYAGIIQNPIFYLIVAGGAWSQGRKLLGYEEMPPGFYNIPFGQKAGITIGYVGLIGSLFALQEMNSRKKKSPKELGYQGKGFDEQLEQLESALSFGEGGNDGDDTFFSSSGK